MSWRRLQIGAGVISLVVISACHHSSSSHSNTVASAQSVALSIPVQTAVTRTPPSPIRPNLPALPSQSVPPQAGEGIPEFNGRWIVMHASCADQNIDYNPPAQIPAILEVNHAVASLTVPGPETARPECRGMIGFSVASELGSSVARFQATGSLTMDSNCPEDAERQLPEAVRRLFYLHLSEMTFQKDGNTLILSSNSEVECSDDGKQSQVHLSLTKEVVQTEESAEATPRVAPVPIAEASVAIAAQPAPENLPPAQFPALFQEKLENLDSQGAPSPEETPQAQASSSIPTVQATSSGQEAPSGAVAPQSQETLPPVIQPPSVQVVPMEPTRHRHHRRSKILHWVEQSLQALMHQ